jgi:hypothetical protein
MEFTPEEIMEVRVIPDERIVHEILMRDLHELDAANFSDGALWMRKEMEKNIIKTRNSLV